MKKFIDRISKLNAGKLREMQDELVQVAGSSKSKVLSELYHEAFMIIHFELSRKQEQSDDDLPVKT